MQDPRPISQINTLIQEDAQYCWHPFTQAATARAPIAMVKGEGAHLIDEDGKRYFDAVSSWWVNLHGHCHPRIASAIAEQATQLEHVMFAGITHPSAVAFAKALIRNSLPPLSKVFFSDNGSTAIEVAMKMACQYWANKGKARRRFVAFKGGYHGDTFGAMAAGRSSGFYTPFESWLLKVDFLPYPATWDGHDPRPSEQKALDCLRAYLRTHGEDTAALLIEPLVQGASGMRMARPRFVEKVVHTCREHGVLTIFDEVMTGFGRTGTLFATKQVGEAPDMLCLSKGLTGGFMPMGATLASDEMYAAFLGDSVDKALLHGHSYTANPLGCAAGLASLELFEHEDTWNQIRTLEAAHRMELNALRDHPAVEQIRQCGTIAAFNVRCDTPGYGSGISQWLREALQMRGVLTRPLGNALYLIPPYCTRASELSDAYRQIRAVLDEWLVHVRTPGAGSEAF